MSATSLTVEALTAQLGNGQNLRSLNPGDSVQLPPATGHPGEWIIARFDDEFRSHAILRPARTVTDCPQTPRPCPHFGRRPHAHPVDDDGHLKPLPPVRIQRERTPGWKKPEGAVDVGRRPGSRWHNPFAVRPIPGCRWQLVDTGGRSTSLIEEPQIFTQADKRYAQAMAVRLFRLHTGPRGIYEYQPQDLTDLQAELAGRTLMCWCAPEAPCHADVLLEYANPLEFTA